MIRIGRGWWRPHRAGGEVRRLQIRSGHTLGHLVLHQQLPGTEDVHAQADRFTAAFLMPGESFREDIPATTTLETFLPIKVRWGVSVQAAIVRAHHVGLITPRKYRTLFQRFSAKGWRTNEPLSDRVPLERPRAFRQIAEMIYGHRLDYSKIASAISYPEPFIRALLDAHAVRDLAQSKTLPHVAPSHPAGPLKFRPSRKRDAHTPRNSHSDG